MAMTDLIPVPAGINAGVSSAKQATMLSLLGNPRESYDQSCRDITNPRLAGLVAIRPLGPFRARGLRPALDSLAQVLADVRAAEPEIHAALGSAGMLCARLVRGSASAISNHSWGTAIDLTLDGVLDAPGNDLVQQGLAAIAPIFNRHGWFWGAGFGREDAMHFECGDALVRRWHRQGLFGPAGPPPAQVLSLGDRGPEVRRLQQALNERAGARLKVDGDFGRATQAAVMAFQAARNLETTGAAGPATLAALGLA